MMAEPERDARIASLLRDAAEWRVLGRLFECPSPEWAADLDRLTPEVHEEPLRDAARRARDEASEGLYHSVFGPGGPAPPREVSYHASVELGSLMSEIEGDYAAFAYQPDTAEPPDHIAVEIGFMAYLRLKEAFAYATGDDDAAAIARATAARFTADHLAHLAHPLAGLLGHSGVAYLAEASALAAARVGPRPPTRQLPVIQPEASVEDADGELSCDV